MADEDPKLQEGGKKKSPNLIIILAITVVVTLIVAAGTSFLILNILGDNIGQSASPGTVRETQVTQMVEIIREGSRYAMMLKGGTDIAVVDAMQLMVGSSEASSAIGNRRIEVLETIRTIFLNKTRSEISSAQGQDFTRRQIRDAVNQIIGFTGEREHLGVNKVVMIVLTITRAN